MFINHHARKKIHALCYALFSFSLINFLSRNSFIFICIIIFAKNNFVDAWWMLKLGEKFFNNFIIIIVIISVIITDIKIIFNEDSIIIVVIIVVIVTDIIIVFNGPSLVGRFLWFLLICLQS